MKGSFDSLCTIAKGIALPNGFTIDSEKEDHLELGLSTVDHAAFLNMIDVFDALRAYMDTFNKKYFSKFEKDNIDWFHLDADMYRYETEDEKIFFEVEHFLGKACEEALISDYAKIIINRELKEK